MKQIIKINFILGFLICTQNTFASNAFNSVWLYGKNASWVEMISAFNHSSGSSCQFGYLFPETAVVHVDEGGHRLMYRYDKSVTAFYKEKLPNVKVLPDFSFWVAKTNFMRWQKQDYIAAAKLIAADVNKDKSADGVFLDLENYQPVLLHFYKTLSSELKKTHKILSVIVRPGQENADWFKTMGDNAIVVLYGYDLHEANDGDYPVSPDIYKARLNKAFIHFIKITQTSHTHAMSGIPVIATTYEWEQKIVSPTKTLTNPYPQIDYINAALQVTQNQHTPLYLGYSVWAFTEPKNNTPFNELPYKISPAAWKILEACGL